MTISGRRMSVINIILDAKIYNLSIFFHRFINQNPLPSVYKSNLSQTCVSSLSLSSRSRRQFPHVPIPFQLDLSVYRVPVLISIICFTVVDPDTTNVLPTDMSPSLVIPDWFALHHLSVQFIVAWHRQV